MISERVYLLGVILNKILPESTPNNTLSLQLEMDDNPLADYIDVALGATDYAMLLLKREVPGGGKAA
uniref:Uncharacterized protein n=1 Tax=viral metagenome TaxID=1070528 RepID=A0A6H1ZLB1_9ZZZZ